MTFPQRPKAREPWSAQDIEQLALKIAEGKSYMEIARELGRSAEAVRSRSVMIRGDSEPAAKRPRANAKANAKRRVALITGD